MDIYQSRTALPNKEIHMENLALQRTPIYHSISAYDACYVALSQRLSVPLVTAEGTGCGFRR
jgi:predicted nucleic acid-binding protein